MPGKWPPPRDVNALGIEHNTKVDAYLPLLTSLPVRVEYSHETLNTYVTSMIGDMEDLLTLYQEKEIKLNMKR